MTEPVGLRPHAVAWTHEKIRDFWRAWETLPDQTLEFYPGLFYDMVLWQAGPHLPSDGDVLDVGAGVGTLLRRLAVRPYRLHAQDISPAGVDALRDALTREGVAIDLRVGEITKIPFDNGSQDVVFMTEVMEHLLPDDLERGLREIHRVLRPGGRLVATTPYRERLSVVLCPDCHALFQPYQHMQSFDEDRVRSLLSAAGFSLVAMHPMPTCAPASTAWKNALKRLIVRWMRPLAFRLWGRGGFLIVARKP